MDAASQTHGETRTQVDTTGAPQDGITHQDGYRARCTVMSVAYLRRMGDMASSDARPGLAPDKLQRVLAFIEQHLAEPLPIERLAAAVHMSPFPSAFRLRGISQRYSAGTRA
jgi:hypothetical protein